MKTPELIQCASEIAIKGTLNREFWSISLLNNHFIRTEVQSESEKQNDAEEEEGDDDNEKKQEENLQVEKVVDPKYEYSFKKNNLKQFFMNAGIVEWPNDWEPFIMLSQDPLTRELGKDGKPIYDALRIADVDSVINFLSIDEDGYISDTRVKQLESIMEKIEFQELPSLHDNPKVVIARISEMIPVNIIGKKLINRVARSITQSEALRWRIGVTALEKVLIKSHTKLQEILISQLISEIIIPDSEIRFRNQLGQIPTADEVSSFVSSVIKVGLKMNVDSLIPEEQTKRIVDWVLKYRNYHYLEKGTLKSRYYYFNVIQEWISATQEIETAFLEVAQLSYIDCLVDVISKDEKASSTETQLPQKVNMDKAKQSIIHLMETNWGSEKKAELHRSLEKLIKLKNPEIRSLILEFFSQNLNSFIIDREFLNFMNSLAYRLYSDRASMEEARWVEAYELVFKAIRQYEDDIKSLYQEGDFADLAELILIAAKDTNEGINLTSLSILESVRRINKKATAIVVDDFIERLFSDLQGLYTEWLSKSLYQLTPEQRELIKAKLDSIVEHDFEDEEFVQEYKRFISNFDNDDLKIEQVMEHAEHVLTSLNSLVEHEGFQRDLFPVIARLFIHNLCPGNAGTVLTELFQEASIDFPVLCNLHRVMEGYWPSPSSNLEGYFPADIFDHAVHQSLEHLMDRNALSILFSLEKMIKNEIVQFDHASSLVTLACSLWRYFPDETSDVIRLYSAVPDLDTIALMKDNLNLSDDGRAKTYKDLLALLSSRLSEVQYIDLGSRFCKSPDSDTFFSIFVEVQSGNPYNRALLSTLNADSTLTLQQKQLVWRIAKEFPNELGTAFFITEIPKAFEDENIRNTPNVVFEKREKITRIFNIDDDKNRLKGTLIQSIKILDGEDAKVFVQKWINELDGIVEP